MGGVFNRNEESKLALQCASDDSVSNIMGKLARPRMKPPMEHLVQKFGKSEAQNPL